jgi:starvation-inducible DNA-binding protein
MNIGLSNEQQSGVLQILNTMLSDEYVLYTKTRNYHRNVVGPQFNDLHKFFEAQYIELTDIADDVAERARALGGHALGTVAEFATHTRLTEHPGTYPSAERW